MDLRGLEYTRFKVLMAKWHSGANDLCASLFFCFFSVNEINSNTRDVNFLFYFQYIFCIYFIFLVCFWYPQKLLCADLWGRRLCIYSSILSKRKKQWGRCLPYVHSHSYEYVSSGSIQYNLMESNTIAINTVPLLQSSLCSVIAVELEVLIQLHTKSIITAIPESCKKHKVS